MLKRLLALLLAALLLLGCAQAGSLDEQLGGYLDVNEKTGFAVTLRLDTLTPHHEDTLRRIPAISCGKLS